MIYPKEKRNQAEMILKNLKDLSVSRSRSRLSWGIPVPGDSSQTVGNHVLVEGQGTLKEGFILIFVKKNFMILIYNFKFFFLVFILISKIFLQDSLFLKWIYDFLKLCNFFWKMTCFLFKLCRNFSWVMRFRTCIEFCNDLII